MKNEKCKLITLLLLLLICFLTGKIDAQNKTMYFNSNVKADICETINYNTAFGNREDLVNLGIFQGFIAIENPIVYTSSEKNNTKEVKLEFKKHVFVFDECNDMIEIGDKTNTSESYEYRMLGWINKKDLIFIPRSLFTDNCISRKCIFVPDLKKLEPVPIPIYNTSSGGSPISYQKGTIANMYFVYKEEKDRILFASSSEIDFSDIGKEKIIGWVDREKITFWNSRMILEVNHGNNANYGKDILFFMTLAASRAHHLNANFGRNSGNVYTHYNVETRNRRAGRDLMSRFPVLREKGNEWTECLVIGAVNPSNGRDIDIPGIVEKTLDGKMQFNIAVLIEEDIFDDFKQKYVFREIEKIIEEVKSANRYKFKVSLGLFNTASKRTEICYSNLRNSSNIEKLIPSIEDCIVGGPNLLIEKFVNDRKVKSRHNNLVIVVSNSSLTLSDANENKLYEKRVKLLSIDTNMDLDSELNFYQSFSDNYTNINKKYEDEYKSSGLDNINNWLSPQYPDVNNYDSLIEERYPVFGSFVYQSDTDIGMIDKYNDIIRDWIYTQVNRAEIVLKEIRDKLMMGNVTDYTTTNGNISTNAQIADILISLSSEAGLSPSEMQKYYQDNLVSKICYTPYALNGSDGSLMKYGVMLEEKILRRITRLEFPEFDCSYGGGVELNTVKEKVQEFYCELFHAVEGGDELFQCSEYSLCKVRNMIWDIPGTKHFTSNSIHPNWCEIIDNADSLNDLCSVVGNIRNKFYHLRTIYENYRLDPNKNDIYVIRLSEASNDAFFWILEDELP